MITFEKNFNKSIGKLPEEEVKIIQTTIDRILDVLSEARDTGQKHHYSRNAQEICNNGTKLWFGVDDFDLRLINCFGKNGKKEK